MSGQALIVDDHPLYRAALVATVGAVCPHLRLSEAGSVAQMLAVLEHAEPPDLILLDLHLPGAHGYSALAHLRGAFPRTLVIVVSAADDAITVRRALAFGACGFISKSASAQSIGEAIQSALRGQQLPAPAGAAPDPAALDAATRLAQLTPQQFRVFGMLCEGKLNKQIAHELGVSEATVKAHMTAVLRKLGAHNRTQAVLLAGHLAITPADGAALAAIPDDSDT